MNQRKPINSDNLIYDYVCVHCQYFFQSEQILCIQNEKVIEKSLLTQILNIKDRMAKWMSEWVSMLVDLWYYWCWWWEYCQLFFISIEKMNSSLMWGAEQVATRFNAKTSNSIRVRLAAQLCLGDV